MPHQIQVALNESITDSSGNRVKADAKRDLDIEVDDVKTIKIYTIDAQDEKVAENIDTIAQELLTDPITEHSSHKKQLASDWAFNWIIEVGNERGVVDNVGKTSRTAIEDKLGMKFGDDEHVYSSTQFLLYGDLTREQVEDIAKSLYNPLIRTAKIMTFEEFETEGGMNIPLPKVDLPPETYVDFVTDMQVVDEDGKIIPEDKVDWEAIEVMGKAGILDPRKKDKDGKPMYRGPLALGLNAAEAIREYFINEARNPTDIELESLAQTWSEHCNHSIFRNLGLYQKLQDTTAKIRELKGENDRCISVFKDNSGVIRFTDAYNINYKVETHNSPSALDPYGGAITGIVGVNRDPLGTGNGKNRNTINVYGFCFGDPDQIGIYDGEWLYKDQARKTPLLHPKTIFEGVRLGVEDGGNKSGIPTSWGFLNFHKNYGAKPLVFVGTVGLMPKEADGEPTHLKKGKPGDVLVMVGNRVGVDGVHGATFSSEAMGEGSPATAVQIGDPFTQKKLADAQYEITELFGAVTDNGAGGLSCSAPELSFSLGMGCEIDLDKIPLKYPGINPNEVWISESQERMTYGVPPENVDKFVEFFASRGVEATPFGVMTEEKRCVVRHKDFIGLLDNKETIMDIDMEFLQKGLPAEKLETTYTESLYRHYEPNAREDRMISMEDALIKMLGRLNICSKEYVVRQFDHEVQGGSAIKPLIGRDQDVHSDASVTRPLLFDEDGEIIESKKGIALSSALFPRMSYIDTKLMAEAAVDTAIRNIVAVGGNPDDVYLLDNFCWCSSDEPKRLGQLERAVDGACEAALAAQAPFISGKDSMFNDYKGFPETIPGGHDEPIKISVPPTLLISSLGVVDDVEKCLTHDFKQAGDLIYVIGETKRELGGSEYLAMAGEEKGGEEYIGNSAPKVDMDNNMEAYRAVYKACQEEIVSSCKSVQYGLGVDLALMAMGGNLGMEVDLKEVPTSKDISKSRAHDDDIVLFSNSMGRMIVAIAPENRRTFENIMKGHTYACIGEVTGNNTISIDGLGSQSSGQRTIANIEISEAKESYKGRLNWGFKQDA